MEHALNARLLRFRSQHHLRPDGREREDAATLARDLMQAGRYGDARGVLVAAQDPDAPEPELLLLEGQAWYEEGAREPALSTFLQVSEAIPDAPEPYYWMGKCLLDADDPLRAATALRLSLARCPETHPDHNRAKLLLHRALTRMDQVDERARLEAARTALTSGKLDLAKAAAAGPHVPTSPGLGIHTLGAVLTPSLATGASSAGDIDAPEMASSAADSGPLDDIRLDEVGDEYPTPQLTGDAPKDTDSEGHADHRASSEVSVADGPHDNVQPSPAEPDMAEPAIAEPDTAEPDTAEPDTAEPDIAEPDTAEPDMAEHYMAEPDIAEPDTAEPDTAEPYMAEPYMAEPDTAEPDMAEPYMAEPDIADRDLAEPDMGQDDGIPVGDSALTIHEWSADAQGSAKDPDDAPLGAFSSSPALALEGPAGERVRGAFSARTLFGDAAAAHDPADADGTHATSVGALAVTAPGFRAPVVTPAASETDVPPTLSLAPHASEATRATPAPGTAQDVPRAPRAKAWALTSATALAFAAAGYLATAHVGLPWLRTGEPPMLSQAGPAIGRMFATTGAGSISDTAPTARNLPRTTEPPTSPGRESQPVAAPGSAGTTTAAPQTEPKTETATTSAVAPDTAGADTPVTDTAGGADGLQETARMLELGQVAEAETTYGRVPNSLAESPEGRLIGARLWLAAGHPRRALRAVTPLRRADNRNVEQLAVIGDVLYAMERVNAAAGAYEQALALDPDHPEALVGRAEIHSRAGRPLDAIPLLRRAAALTTERTPGLLSRVQTALGHAYLQRGQGSDRQLAENALRRALRFTAPPPAAHFWLGESLAARDTPGATRAYVRYLELEPSGRYARRARRALGPLLSD